AVRRGQVSMHIADEYGETEAEVRVGRDMIEVELDGRTVTFARPTEEGEIRLVRPDAGGTFLVCRRDGEIQIARRGLAIAATVQPTIDMSLSHGHVERAGNAIVAPLHGVVSKLYVAVGETVEKGAPVLQMEAMKLIHTLSAAVAGHVGAIRCTLGET